ncbi:HTH-type transcriptional repressor GlaR [Vibrio stylophorae]|uniref:HTH-type transcriptional repressor GlaR n=1 Tax=Vibrio stylophorae TaxID=659351 RepID=A0ABN8DSR4_9VIBR|nr:GntR family transcriptional regulator [Vibrio stylophorae]CAH0532452.1 HTH-type transcriptional repressor GlaR [Vibrio stylophorae]
MSTPTLAQKVQQKIADDILLGHYQPKEKLVVAELKSRYQIGASPVREALVQLAWQNYVTLEPQKGCWVAPVSREEFSDLSQTLQLLMTQAVAQSIAMGGEEWEVAVITSYHKLNRMDLQAEDFCANTWGQKRLAFFQALISECQSPSLMRFIDTLCLQLARYRHIWLDTHRQNPEQVAIITSQHERMMKAVLARDIKLVRHEMIHQFDYYMDSTLSAVA